MQSCDHKSTIKSIGEKAPDSVLTPKQHLFLDKMNSSNTPKHWRPPFVTKAVHKLYRIRNKKVHL